MKLENKKYATNALKIKCIQRLGHHFLPICLATVIDLNDVASLYSCEIYKYIRVEEQDEVVMPLENKTASLSFIFVLTDVSIWLIHHISMRFLAISEQHFIPFRRMRNPFVRLSHAPKQ